MAYIGNNLTVQQYSPQIAYFSGNGSTTAFTLPVGVVSSAQIIVIVANVIQNPSSAYTVSGTTLTFTSAPPSGTNNIWVEYTSLQTNTVAPSAGTVQNSSFGAVTAIPMTYGTIGAGDASLMKNRIINGAMQISQRNGTSTVTPALYDYTIDRWQTQVTQSGKYTLAQSTSAPAGFPNSMLITSTSAYSITTTDCFDEKQYIEGFNCYDLAWGTANAKTVTLSFWVQSSLTGTFGGSIQNANGNRSYPFSYTISSANTWTQASITISGDITGTWMSSNNSVGMAVLFGLGVGSTLTNTAGSWAAGDYRSATGATSVVGTNGATFYITGVQLEVGSSATGFEYRQFQQELALCQRYFSKSYDYSVVPGTANTITGAVGIFSSLSSAFIALRWKVSMRATPTVTTYNYQGTAGYMSGGSYASLTATAYQTGTEGSNIASGTGNPGNDYYVNYAVTAEL